MTKKSIQRTLMSWRRKKTTIRIVSMDGDSLLCGHDTVPSVNLLTSPCIFSSLESRELQWSKWPCGILDRRSAKSSFEQCANGMPDAMHCMRLSWCKVPPHNGNKTAGWTSETHLAMSRLNKWFCGGIEKITHEDCVSDLDILPPSCWPKKHNAAWLCLRGWAQKDWLLN